VLSILTVSDRLGQKTSSTAGCQLQKAVTIQPAGWQPVSLPKDLTLPDGSLCALEEQLLQSRIAKKVQFQLEEWQS
jgi:hypothetical protein